MTQLMNKILRVFGLMLRKKGDRKASPKKPKKPKTVNKSGKARKENKYTVESYAVMLNRYKKKPLDLGPDVLKRIGVIATAMCGEESIRVSKRTMEDKPYDTVNIYPAKVLRKAVKQCAGLIKAGK